MEIHWGPASQAYVTPIADDEVCVVIMAETARHAQFAAALPEMPALQHILCGASFSSRQRGAVTSMRSLRRVQRRNVALIGDASGGVDAIAGEGLRLAFCQANVLADAMVSGNLSEYQRAHRRIASRPMLMGNLMLFLSRHPRLRARSIRAMQQEPQLFSRLLSAHVGKASFANLLTNGALLGLRLTVPQGAPAN
jgi:flavin-dependent dehydrogenase